MICLMCEVQCSPVLGLPAQQISSAIGFQPDNFPTFFQMVSAVPHAVNLKQAPHPHFRFFFFSNNFRRTKFIRNKFRLLSPFFPPRLQKCVPFCSWVPAAENCFSCRLPPLQTLLFSFSFSTLPHALRHQNQFCPQFLASHAKQNTPPLDHPLNKIGLIPASCPPFSFSTNSNTPAPT